MKRRIMALLCVALLIFSGSIFGEREVEVPAEYRDAIVFGMRILRDYYGNKDLSEHRDLSGRVSLPMEKLLNAKIEMEQFQREKLHLDYENYSSSLLATSMESWSIKNDEYFFSVQSVRTWNYSGVEEKSTSSEVWNLRVKKTKDGMRLIECFEAYDNLTLGPIDRKAKAYSEKYDSREYDAFLENFVQEFKEQCMEKSGSKLIEMSKQGLSIESKQLILMSVMSLWVIWAAFSG